MKYLHTIVIMLLHLSLWANDKDSTINYALPDSIRAVQFIAELTIHKIESKREVYAGIRTDVVSLSLQSDRNEKEIGFEFPSDAGIIVTGMDTKSEKGEIEWDYNWSLDETYKLMVAVATDSAENFSLYSGYIFLPKENKWKLIGTCRIAGRWTTIKAPAIYYSAGRKAAITGATGQVWAQRSNGTWKDMKDVLQDKNQASSPPLVNLFGHVDSVQQRQADIKLIEAAISSGKTDVKQNEQSVYYIIMKEGTGKQVSVNDTVVAHYKGYLFADGKVFDQTKQNPATFPLRRLIRGWQIGVPLVKVGGTIKLVIPSDMAYSIRTRAAKIPPNSILVFEIEVVDVRSPE
jgi:FKBP-type peptidyl-prolyl cis-trans isomerase FkpA